MVNIIIYFFTFQIFGKLKKIDLAKKSVFIIKKMHNMSTTQETAKTNFEVINFMGGKSFKLFNPLNRLKLVAYSSFLGEPTYYQPTDKKEPKNS